MCEITEAKWRELSSDWLDTTATPLFRHTESGIAKPEESSSKVIPLK